LRRTRTVFQAKPVCIMPAMPDEPQPASPGVKPIKSALIPNPTCSSQQRTVCDRCGGANVYRMHAVWRCADCGSKPDCFGWYALRLEVRATAVAPASDEFRANAAAMQAAVDALRAARDRARAGGGPKPLERHRAQGKLPVRERIDRLLDQGSPFL